MRDREKDVESYLVEKLKRIGVPCIKFIPDRESGMPDRLVLLPNEKVVWVELKTEGGKLSRLQEYQHERLRRMGHRVEVVWNKEQADEICERLKEQVSGIGNS